jgi:DNA-binding protein HU-beta
MATMTKTQLVKLMAGKIELTNSDPSFRAGAYHSWVICPVPALKPSATAVTLAPPKVDAKPPRQRVFDMGRASVMLATALDSAIGGVTTKGTSPECYCRPARSRENVTFQGRVSPKENTLMATMTKTQLVKLMAGKIELTNKQAATFLETLAAVAVVEAKKNGVFVVPGLGRLKKVQRKARMGRNPQTGEAIKIKAKTVAKFYVAKAVKDAIAPPKK